MDVVRAFGIMLGFSYGVGIIISLAFIGFNPGGGLSDSTVLIILALSQGIMIMTAWFFSVEKYRVQWSRLGFRKPLSRSHLVFAVAVGVVGVGVAYGYAAVIEVIGPDVLVPPPSTTPLDENDSFLIFFALIAVLGAPIAEEVFFRGFALPSLANRMGFLPATVLTSAVFAAIHIEVWKMIPIFVLALALAGLYARARTIFAPVLAHFSYNLVITLIEVF